MSSKKKLKLTRLLFEELINDIESLGTKDIRGHSDEANLALEAFRHKLLPYLDSKPFQIPLPESHKDFLKQNPSVNKIWNKIKEKVYNYFEFETQHLYPYYDWQTIDPKSFFIEFLNLQKVTSTFSIESTRVATLGSCFASHMANHFKQRGVQVHNLPYPEEWNNPLIISLFLSFDYELDEQSKKYRVLKNSETSTEYSKASQERRERYPEHDYEHAFGKLIEEIKEADIVLFTLGTAFGFYREEDGHFVDINWMGKEGGNKTSHKLFPLEMLVKSLREIVVRIKHLSPNAKIILTLSPIPIKGVIGIEHGTAVEFDCVSKSTSRIALHHLKEQKDIEWEYFPSYEIVRSLAPTCVDHTFTWKDPRHPSMELINLIVELFIEKYFN